MRLFGFIIFITLFLSATTMADNLNIKLPIEARENFSISRAYETPPTHINNDKYAVDFTQDTCKAYGKKVIASFDGQVTETLQTGRNRGYGTVVDLKNKTGLISRYAHMIPDSIVVEKGQEVVQGEVLGQIGNSGNVDGIACPQYPGTHLHFAMYQKQADGTIVAYKPEPISGYTDLVAGMTLQSDNVLVQDTGMFSIFANAVHAMTGIFTSSPPPEEPTLETTPKEIVQQINPPPADISLNPTTTDTTTTTPLQSPTQSTNIDTASVALPEPKITTADIPILPTTDSTSTEIIAPPPIIFSIQPVIDMASAAPTQSPSPSKQDNTVVTDTTPPDFTFSIGQCNQSLSPDECLIANTSVTLNLSSSANDFAYYTLTCTANGTACANFPTATTTATTTLYTAPSDNTTYTFTAQATDTNNNTSTTKTQTVEVISRPLVINEVAWAGTSATRDQDEWMELYNPTSQSITLTNWVLRSQTDDSPFIQLSGTIPAKGFFLLERTDDNTISDITANQTYTGALVNTGEILELSYASSTIDTTPNTSGCGGWCAGAASGSYYSMERYDPLAAGNDASNWSNWQGFLGNGKNADGVTLNGTPGKRNSVNYLVTKTGVLTQSKTLSVSNSPYMIAGGFGISSAGTLIIDAGTVIKFLNTNSSLTTQGTLLAQGTAANPIIFTSFLDDTYGGDMNQNGASTTPQSGDWSGIIFDVGSSASILDNTILRYAGSRNSFVDPKAGIQIKNTSITMRNSTIEKNYTTGIWMKNSPATTISDSIIRDHTDATTEPFFGILLTSSSTPTITNTLFQNNKTNIATNTHSSFVDGGGNTPNPL